MRPKLNKQRSAWVEADKMNRFFDTSCCCPCGLANFYCALTGPVCLVNIVYIFGNHIDSSTSTPNSKTFYS